MIASVIFVLGLIGVITLCLVALLALYLWFCLSFGWRRAP